MSCVAITLSSVQKDVVRALLLVWFAVTVDDFTMARADKAPPRVPAMILAAMVYVCEKYRLGSKNVRVLAKTVCLLGRARVWSYIGDRYLSLSSVITSFDIMRLNYAINTRICAAGAKDN